VSCGVYSDCNGSRSFDVIVQLPSVSVVKLPVFVELDIPSVISVQSSATVTYTIHNRSDSLQDFDIVVESSDAFMFAGHRQVSAVRCYPLCISYFLSCAFSAFMLLVGWQEGHPASKTCVICGLPCNYAHTILT